MINTRSVYLLFSMGGWGIFISREEKMYEREE